MMTMMLYGWFDENNVDTMNVSDINSPNENDGTTTPVINYIKEWIEVLGLKMFKFLSFINIIYFFNLLMFCSFSYLCMI